MKWGFILVTLYMGPLGLLLYVLADKEPRPGTHEEFTSPLWKQGDGEHHSLPCGRRHWDHPRGEGLRRCSVWPMWVDLVVEYWRALPSACSSFRRYS